MAYPLASLYLVSFCMHISPPLAYGVRIPLTLGSYHTTEPY